MNVIVNSKVVELTPCTDNYFIIGHSYTGSFHQSEPLTFEEVLYQIEKYDATVEYFGGGTVSVYHGSKLMYSYTV